MSAPASDRATVDELRFREALRTLPRRVWIVSLGILVNQVGNFLPVFIVLYLIERGHSAGTAGLVLGAAPAAWVFLDFPSYVSRLDDVPEMWGHTTFGLSYLAFALYPVVAGLLLGAAFAGRWRRPPVTT